MMVFRMVYNGESAFLLNNKVCLGLKAIHAKRKKKKNCKKHFSCAGCTILVSDWLKFVWEGKLKGVSAAF